MTSVIPDSVLAFVVVFAVLLGIYPAALALIATWRQGQKLIANTTDVPQLLGQLHADMAMMAERLEQRGRQIQAMQETIGIIHADTNHAFVEVKGDLVSAKNEVVAAKQEIVELKRQVTALIPEKKP